MPVNRRNVNPATRFFQLRQIHVVRCYRYIRHESLCVSAEGYVVLPQTLGFVIRVYLETLTHRFRLFQLQLGVEHSGFEPLTFCLQSRYATIALMPQKIRGEDLHLTYADACTGCWELNPWEQYLTFLPVFPSPEHSRVYLFRHSYFGVPDYHTCSSLALLADTHIYIPQGCDGMYTLWDSNPADYTAYKAAATANLAKGASAYESFTKVSKCGYQKLLRLRNVIGDYNSRPRSSRNLRLSFSFTDASVSVLQKQSIVINRQYMCCRILYSLRLHSLRLDSLHLDTNAYA